jgi:hypothetical protein
VTELALEQVSHVKDLKLPEGVEVLLPPERTIAHVITSKRGKEEETTTAEAAPKEEPKAT